ncbi:MAG: S1 RNA-binding domain-containing protein [Bacillota bacterium]|nr:S1 RNA-binding domain-containing protein [Bacillota bacterium]
MSEENKMNELLEDFEFVNIHPGKKIKGKVISVDKEKALINFGYKSDGVLKKEEYSLENVEDLTEELEIGDEIAANVIANEDDDGNVRLSRKGIEVEEKWEEIEELYNKKEDVTVKVFSVNKSGCEVKLKGFNGFIPRSHLSTDRSTDPKDFLNKELTARIIEAKKTNRRNRLILSRKVIELEEKREQEKEAWESIEVGKEYTGTVNKIKNFGAFVEVEGIEGLLHINEISWVRIGHPKDVISEGDEITVKVLSKDIEKRRMSLSLKATVKRPWEKFVEKYNVGEVVEGKIVNLTDFGAFVEIDDVQGLLHVSDISWDMVEKPSDVLKEGDTLEVKILNIDNKRERLSLGVKQLTEDPFVEFTKNLKKYDMIKGKVKSMSVEGIVVEFDDQFESFVPMKKITRERLRTPAEKFENGQEVECKILGFDNRKKQLEVTMITERPENKNPKQNDQVSYTLGDDNITIGDLLKKDKEE